MSRQSEIFNIKLQKYNIIYYYFFGAENRVQGFDARIFKDQISLRL